MPRPLVSTLILASLLSGACGAPSSFDGVTGGSKGSSGGSTQPALTDPGTAAVKQDDSLAAPRQLSPISVSFVSTARPRLRWLLDDQLSGAVVELARTRDFKGAIKTYTVTGTELVIAEDLELGVWFWRLKGVTSAAVGTAPSPVWELLVRGPAAHGTSDAPSRGMVDVNGDGEPDLVVAETDIDASQGAGDGGPPPTLPVISVLPGQADHTFTLKGSDGLAGMDQSPYTGPISIGGGTDFDGDGLTDIVEAGTFAYVDGAATKLGASVIYASRDPEHLLDYDRGAPIYTGPDGTILPFVSAGGDVDGDGYGDAVVGRDNLSFLALGSVAKSFSQLAVVPVGYPGDPAASGRSRAALGAFDANGDGLADVLFSYTESKQSGAFVAPGDHGLRVGAPTSVDSASSAPTAFAAGDFNGDGIDDVAFTMTSGTSSQICVSYGDRNKMLVPGGCLGTPPGETELGLSLTAADLEGDGVDEILATTKTSAYGIRVIRAVSTAMTTSTIVTPVPGVGVRLTTVWPGRPGPARWAAAAADGSHVEVFEGDTFASSIYPGPYSSGFGRGLR